MKTRITQGAALLSVLALAFPVASRAGVSVGISVGVAPPAIPVYEQPPCPQVGYLWTPGYWAWSADVGDYYWVPGAWIAPPSFGMLWTPGYWGFSDGAYLWHAGYWGPHVGFYGGINYGFGYFGSGFEGGRWRGHEFLYNRAAANVRNISGSHVYNHTVVNNFGSNHAGYNGPRGVEARPSHQDMLAARDAHRGITGPQRAMMDSARHVPGAMAGQNHGHPETAVQRSANFGHRSVEPVHRDARVTRIDAAAPHHAVPHGSPAHSSTFAAEHPAQSRRESPPTHAMQQHTYPTQHYSQPRQASVQSHVQAPRTANAESRHTATSRPAAPQHENASRAMPQREAPQRLEAHAQPAPRRAGPDHETHR
jgi:hypothetical protein